MFLFLFLIKRKSIILIKFLKISNKRKKLNNIGTCSQNRKLFFNSILFCFYSNEMNSFINLKLFISCVYLTMCNFLKIIFKLKSLRLLVHPKLKLYETDRDVLNIKLEIGQIDLTF